MMNREKLLRSLFLLYAAALLVAVGSLLPWSGWRMGKSHAKLTGSLAIIRIYGEIDIHSNPSAWSSPDADDVAKQLHELSKNNSVKAILLRINSPGGTVGAVQEIHEEILRCKSSGKVVVASLGDVAASGGYYLASACDRVVSEPGTIVGSIGVILQFGNLEGLMQKLGIRWETIKSGPYKDVGSPTRALTLEERKFLQSSIDDAYAQFVDAVAQGRKLPREKILKVADGRIFTGRQAKEQGLVDDLGNWRDAEDTAIRLAHLPENPTIVSDNGRGLNALLHQISSEHQASPFQAASDAWQGPQLEYRWR